MQASLPHVSVVIPTRERCDKLQHALSTCVNQNYDNLTILVSDNCSQDSTEEVVRETPDPRVKYVKTPCRVDMSTNWEFALSHVKGGLIIFVGDDDGLVPNCVEIATGLMRDFQSEAICWTPASYGWPCHPVPAYRNRLSFSKNLSCQWIDGNKAVRRYYEHHSDASQLLSVYCGALVPLRHFREVQKKTGKSRFFDSTQPDLYSSLALSEAVGKYIKFGAPLAIAGGSSSSNGANATADRIGLPNAGEHRKYAEEMADFFSDCPIPICKIRAWYYGEPLIALADVSTALPTKKEVIRQVLRWIAKDMTTRGSRETYDECVTSIRATCAALNMTSFAEKLIKNAPYRSFELESLREISNSPGVSSFSDSHELETGNLGVCNIDDCSRLLRACLGSVGAVRVRSPTEQFLRKAVFSIARRINV